MEANVQALRRRKIGSAALARYDEVARLLTGKPTAQATEAVAWVHNLCLAFRVPSLAQFRLKEQDFAAIVAKAKKSSSMKGNPIELTDEELLEIIRRANRQTT
jgi:alcohol dehydrogenase class IV